MTSTPRAGRTRTGALVRTASFVVVVVLVIAGAVLAQGYDTKQTPVTDGALWVLNKSGANKGQYARVDTRLRELDTVESAELPSTIVQYDSTALIVTTENASIAQIDQARPAAYASDSPELRATPAGTSTIEVTGDHIGYLTSLGTIYVATVSDGVTSAPGLVDPFADADVAEGQQAPIFDAIAIAVGVDGILYAYSASAGAVFRYDIAAGEPLGMQEVVDPPAKDAVAALTAVGDDWVLFDTESMSVWTAGEAPRPTGITAGGALAVQRSSVDDGFAYVATGDGLHRVDLGDGSTRRVLDATGVPARPASIGSERFAAWLPGAATAGTMWRSSSPDAVTLATAGRATPENPEPDFRSDGSTLVLNETVSGWVWTASGDLVPSSQDWDLTKDDDDTASEDAADETPPDQPEPPVAVADELGVRAGALVTLPVLLNDSDPNTGDVLTIVPESVAGSPPSFGALSLTANDQQLTIAVDADASGSSTFRYAVTDGAFASEPAEVTLTVYGEDVQNPPVLCDESTRCSAQPAAALQVSPGGSVRQHVLGAVIDPEGDPFYIEGAALDAPSAVLGLAALPGGEVVVQHEDPSAGAATASATVTVADAGGSTMTFPIGIAVLPQAVLTVDSFAVTTHVGETITVDPSSHIRGSTGQFSIATLIPPDDADTSAVLNSDGRTFAFRSVSPGSYSVNFSVESSGSTAVAQARITVLDDARVRLAAAPLTVFVRPGLDATVDVLNAVSNPGGRVLLLTGAVQLAQEGRNSLVVDVVDHRLLRVKGSVSGGGTGTIGVVEYTVSDSAGGAGSITGRATVIMLGRAPEARPVAIDDRITVRAGTQVDVEVLDNDVAPHGNSVVLAGESLAYPEGRGLAFASGSRVRILAPEQEGDYTITYAVYAAGYPGQRDTAEVHVTVRSAEGNSAPQPRPLEARVYAGETVSIPFTASGIDPDGDAVHLDRIETQPQAGAGIASIAARGDAVQYTAPAAFTGVAEFAYRVTDTAGETATALVRVGVLSYQSDPAPVTFSDYVEVTAGVGSTAVVRPLDNDIDPRGAPLALGEVRPDVPPTLVDGSANPEYTALAALITTAPDGSVTLRAGTEPGTTTFSYDVANATSSSTGYIVLSVVRAAVPDLPVVTDSYLSIDDRSAFSRTGIDVVSGKVSWVSGDVGALTLRLWGEQPGFRATGDRIAGPLRDATAVIPFQLSGTDRFGAPVTTFGFLTVPGTNDIIVALKAGIATPSVPEDESVAFDMAELVSIPQGDAAVVSAAVAAGQRAAAACTLRGTAVTYTAGHGSPWDDACVVTIRLASQDADRLTQLVVPVAVEPVDAQPVLSSATQTSRPGEDVAATVFDLDTMTTEWKGVPEPGDLAALEYSFSPASLQSFDLDYDRQSHLLSIKAVDSALEGRQERVTIAYTGRYAGQTATLTLEVGPAPETLPRGASVTLACTVSDDSCGPVTVVGGTGEVNAFATPLELVSVQSASAACPGVTFAASGSSAVSVTFPREVSGGTCQVSFVVRDAQGTATSGSRDGTVSLDLRGFPKPPGSVRQVGYGDGTVDLRVDPGNAPSSYPGVDHFVVQRGGRDLVECSADGACPEITGLVNGASQSYVVFTVAKETADRSLTSVQTDAYSYAKPTIGSVTATPVFDRARTTVAEGAVEVAISGPQADVQYFEIRGVDGRVPRQEGITTTRITLGVGERDLVISPVSRFPPPPGDGPVAESRPVHVRVAGLPTFSAQPGTPTPGETQLTVDGAALAANSSVKPLEYLYVAYPVGTGTPRCEVADTGGSPTISGVAVAGRSTTPTIEGLRANKEYSVVVCGSNGFGAAQSAIVTQATFQNPGAPTGAYTFDVDPSPQLSRRDGADGVAVASYYTRSTITRVLPVPDDFHAEFDGADDLGVGSTVGVDPGVRARYCLDSYPDRCGDWAAVAPADPATRAMGARVSMRAGDASTCVGGQTFVVPGIDAVPSGRATAAAVDPAAIRYQRQTAAGWTSIDNPTAPYAVPADAERALYETTVTWAGDLSGLEAVVLESSVSCTPTSTPTPTPTATETPTP